ncbi:MAG: phosphodiester glycosidase family protein, partial [Planctomycetia bacterium]|nr:phosphodiester glycosidase family protein [Planctomycetia bacterium]
TESRKRSGTQKRQPQDAIGYSADRRFLYLICADGEQMNYSYGINGPDLRDLMDALKIEELLTLAGTGVATLAISDGAGGVEVLNRPTHADIPGLERPFVMSVGIHADPLP